MSVTDDVKQVFLAPGIGTVRRRLPRGADVRNEQTQMSDIPNSKMLQII